MSQHHGTGQAITIEVVEEDTQYAAVRTDADSTASPTGSPEAGNTSTTTQLRPEKVPLKPVPSSSYAADEVLTENERLKKRIHSVTNMVFDVAIYRVVCPCSNTTELAEERSKREQHIKGLYSLFLCEFEIEPK